MSMSRLAATEKAKAVKSDDFVWHVTQAPRAGKNTCKPALEAAREHFPTTGKPLGTAICLQMGLP